MSVYYNEIDPFCAAVSAEYVGRCILASNPTLFDPVVL